MEKVSKEMLVNEVLEMDSGMTKIFFRHGLDCLGCPASYSESIAEAAKGHGADVEKLVRDLNEFMEKK